MKMDRMTCDATVPFIINNFDSFESLEGAYENQYTNLFALDVQNADCTGMNYKYFSLEFVLNAFYNDTLTVNIFDSPLNDIIGVLPDWWIKLAKERSVPEHKILSWIISPAGAITDFHIDPKYGNGAFVYLAEGVKIWEFRDLVTITQNSGDFLWFPSRLEHKVTTTSKAIGVGGYL
jgi:hypothetical protein